MDVEKRTLQFVGFIQIALGLVFLLIPNEYAAMLELESAPKWVLWLFMMMSARFIGYGIGMFAAAKNPSEHSLWIQTMIAIQAMDWIATLLFLFRGDLTLSQVTTATIFPIIFILILSYFQIKRNEPSGSQISTIA